MAYASESVMPLQSSRQSYIEENAQSVQVSAALAITPVVRDTFTATTVEELAAMKAAEAARVAAEYASTHPKTSTVNRTGLAGSQIFAADSIISAAQQWVGQVPYGTGNNPAESFSCDGYVQYVFAQNGISLPRGADNQGKLGTVISQSEAKAGDLVWWQGQHIAIYDGNGGYYHSPTYGRYVEHSSSINWGNPVFVRL